MNTISNICPQCGNLCKTKFCNKSCAASYNNRVYPKRQASVWPCIRCGKDSPYRRKYCLDCKQLLLYRKLEGLSMGAYKALFSKDSVAYTALRGMAKSRWSGECSCAICGYTNHVQLCHILDLHKIPDDSPAKVAVSRDNLIQLCPNHHWEFDHGML